MDNRKFRVNGELKIKSNKYSGEIEGTNDIPVVKIDPSEADLDEDLYEVHEKEPEVEQNANAIFYIKERNKKESRKNLSGKRVYPELYKLPYLPPRVAESKTKSTKVKKEFISTGGKSRRKRKTKPTRRNRKK